ncbi:MAG: protein-L-isoaspartate(D-aspartate) O-methyltransferase [Alphaproteobacteria bacterium]|nr:protein-L-isoaspartate(D-aspartate) O-methyltransferase [Alphaproteobacteria bacterium SS10]
MIEEARKIRLIMGLRRAGVTDTGVLSALERVPREVFLPPLFLDQAYDDVALPIGLGQTISQPSVVGYMTQQLELNDRHKVLEIGTGSGYQTAILARLCRRIYSIELHRELLAEAESRFDELRLYNITTQCGNGGLGWPEQAPFDRIIMTCAAASDPPRELLDQLAVGGILILPLTDPDGSQFLYKLRRTETDYEGEQLWPVRFVPLLPLPTNHSDAQVHRQWA